MATNENTLRPTRKSPLWQAYQSKRYAILFYALLLTLLILPVVTELEMPAVLVRVLLGGSLLAAVMPNATQRTRRLLLAGVLLLLAAQFVPVHGQLSVVPMYVRGLIAITGLVAAAGALRFVVTSRTVDSETVYAALGTYLLAGIFFGQIYWLVDSAHPGSVVGPDPFSEFNAVYYSFITLATLGYGDYVPRIPITRGIAAFEVIGGQLFLAVLVARLIAGFTPKEE